MMANPAFAQAAALFARRPHARRTDLAREADRALDPVRPRCRRDDPRSPPPHPQLRAEQRSSPSSAGPSNDFGTVVSRIDIVRAVAPGEAYQTLPFVRPGGEILLRISGWPKVERVFAGDRRRRSARHRSGRRRAGSLAACPQPPRRRIRAASLYAATSIAPGSCGGACCHDALRLRHDDVFRARWASAHRALFHPAPRLIWNASASVPIGLYAVHPAGALHVTELVVVQPPEAARELPRRAPLSAQGRADAEACPRASWADRLPHRPRNHRRRHRHGRGARSRSKRPTASRLAGLPRHCRPAKSS